MPHNANFSLPLGRGREMVDVVRVPLYLSLPSDAFMKELENLRLCLIENICARHNPGNNARKEVHLLAGLSGT